MARTLLQLVQAATAESGFPVPSSLFGNTDQGVVQILALAQREGREFWEETGPWGSWPLLRADYSFQLVPVGPYTGNLTSGSSTISGLSSTTGIQVGYVPVGSGIYPSATVTAIGVGTVTMSSPASSSGTGVSIYFSQVNYALPSDYGFMLPQTQWDQNFRWQLLGPLDQQEWNVLKYGISPAGPRIRFKMSGGYFVVNPPPGSTQTDVIAFSYCKNTWCQSSGGTAQSLWAADTDTYLLDEDAFIRGMKWRMKQAKGLDATVEMKEYTRGKDRLLARAGGSRSLPLNASASGIRLLNNQNVPDTGFGS